MVASPPVSKSNPVAKSLVSGILSAVGCVALAFLVQYISGQFLSSYANGLVFQAATFVTLAVSLNIVNGITGQFSIGHYAFFQIGAYTTGALSLLFWKKFQGAANVPMQEDIWIVLMMFFGIITSAFAGWIVGLPSLRLRGDYLAIVTLGFGEIIRISAENFTFMGGATGTKIAPEKTVVWLAWLLAFAAIGLSRNLLKSVHGLAFLSVREDEIAATAMGVNITRTKVAAFVIGSAFAGAAGVLYAHQQTFISPDLFKMDGSFIVLTMVIFGGTGSITGSALAGASLFYLPEALRELPPVPFASLVGIVLGLIATIGALKRYSDQSHAKTSVKAATMIGIIVVGIVFMAILGKLLSFVPSISAHAPIQGSQLRLVVFAVTLIVLMLFRPQGVFAHHEFSWKWLRSVLARVLPKQKEGLSS